MYRLGPVQQKFLLILLGGLVLGTETSSARYFRKLRSLRRAWQEINQQSFNRSIRRLREQRLVEERHLADGSFRLVLTPEGRRQAKRQQLLGQSIRFRNPKRWDGKWRIVMFDVPEESRAFRDILRDHLRELKFYKLQHSVFVSPLACEKPLQELVSLYEAEAYVRIVTADWIDNAARLKRHFFPSKKHT